MRSRHPCREWNGADVYSVRQPAWSSGVSALLEARLVRILFSMQGVTRSGFCQHCYMVSQVQQEALDAKCYYCSLVAQEVTARACTYDIECGRLVFLCNSCAELRHGVVCGKCWRRDWSGKCFQCKGKVARQDIRFGRYCKSCHGVVTEEGRRSTLAGEQDELEARMAKLTLPTGEEPALQLLVLPCITGRPLRTYAKEASFLSPIHCRLCEALDCLSHSFTHLGSGKTDRRGRTGRCVCHCHVRLRPRIQR